MKKILFPTEFSDHASEAFKFAQDLAYFFKADLIVMHAFGKPGYRMNTPLSIEAREEKVIEKMVAFVTDHLNEDYQEDIQVNYITKVGYPAEAILKVAMEEDVDLIIMGMTGKTNAIGNLMGSVALKVLNKAESPILLIPATAKFIGIDNIVYTTNFEFRDLGAINYLRKWAEVYNAPVHCLHVTGAAENGLTVMKRMNILKTTYKGKTDLHFDLVEGDFRTEIEKFATQKKADIVAMMAHKGNLISRIMNNSSVDGVARRISLPLLVLKDDAYESEKDLEEWLEVVNSIA